MELSVKRHLAYLAAIVFNVTLAVLVVSGTAFYVVNIRDRAVKRESGSPVLEVKDSASGKIFQRWVMEEGSEFALEFIHSVNQSPVRETFAVEGDMIRLRTLRFYSYGAGIPAYLEEGWILSRDGDAMVISGLDRPYREISYIVGTVSDHLLYVNEDVYSLRDIAGTNARITISLEN